MSSREYKRRRKTCLNKHPRRRLSYRYLCLRRVYLQYHKTGLIQRIKADPFCNCKRRLCLCCFRGRCMPPHRAAHLLWDLRRCPYRIFSGCIYRQRNYSRLWRPYTMSERPSLYSPQSRLPCAWLRFLRFCRCYKRAYRPLFPQAPLRFHP